MASAEPRINHRGRPHRRDAPLPRVRSYAPWLMFPASPCPKSRPRGVKAILSASGEGFVDAPDAGLHPETPVGRLGDREPPDGRFIDRSRQDASPRRVAVGIGLRKCRIGPSGSMETSHELHPCICFGLKDGARRRAHSGNDPNVWAIRPSPPTKPPPSVGKT